LLAGDAVSGGRSGIEPTKPGIPPALYKNLERSLLDSAAMQVSLKNTLAPAAIERMLRDPGAHVSPVSSGAKDDIQKLEKDETIIAIKLAYESRSKDQARDVVQTLAGLVRETLITGIAMERIESEALASSNEALSLLERRTELLAVNRSLEHFATDLEQLAKQVPESPSTREVVDTREGGHYFLPARVQLVGARATHADNEHTIRVYDQALARHTLFLSFLHRLQERSGKGTDTFAVSDMPTVIDAELKEFFRESGASDLDSRYLQTKMEILRDELATFRGKTRFIQYPTTLALSRAPWAAALASLAVVFFIAAAFVAELWQRPGETRSLEDAAASRKSA
jgi:hypothetical protein